VQFFTVSEEMRLNILFETIFDFNFSIASDIQYLLYLHRLNQPQHIRFLAATTLFEAFKFKTITLIEVPGLHFTIS
jgi:hypothetical protein